MSSFRLIYCLVFALALGLAHPVMAQDQSKGAAQGIDKATPYDGPLLRLSQVLGALDFLRNLCAENRERQWRASMQALLDAETKGEAARRARLTAAFNRGYRTFSALYQACTPESKAISEKYRIEGATLATEITARFGN